MQNSWIQNTSCNALCYTRALSVLRFWYGAEQGGGGLDSPGTKPPWMLRKDWNSWLTPMFSARGFPGGSDKSTCNVGELGSVPGLGRSPGGGHGYPLQYSCLEIPHGQRSLAGYSPWGRKESDTTERLSTRSQPDRKFLNDRDKCSHKYVS